MIAILLIFATLATVHSIIVPLTTGNDEWAHFLYVRFITEHRHLPTTPAERSEAGYKSDAPALYHLLVSAVTAGVGPTRLLRPLDSPRRYLADNIIDSYALVHTAAEQFPYRGEVLVWHLGRCLSILFGLTLIGLTYLTCLSLFPGNRRRVLLAAALPAFIPAVLFHSSVLSYESLSATTTALFLLVAIKTIRQPHHWRWWLALGALAGLSVTVKYSAVLLPLEVVFIAWLALARQQGSKTADEKSSLPARQLLYGVAGRVLVAGFAAILVSSWWFGFVVWHFNTIDMQGNIAGVLQPLLVGDASDTTSVKVAGFLFGAETVEAAARPPLARNYPQLLRLLLESFWAAPVAGRFTPVISPWLPLAFTLVALVGLAGLGRVWQRSDTSTRTMLALLVVHAGLILPLIAARILFSFDPREVVQGRHILLPAASAIAVLLVWGWEQWSPKIGWFVVVGLFLWTGLGQLGWAAIVYPPPIPVWSTQPPTAKIAAAQPQDSIFAGAIHLTAASWRNDVDSLEVTLWWQSLALVTEDYLVELALLDQANRVVGYNLSHPVQGRYPTRAWEPGDVIQDVHKLPFAQPLAGSYRLQLRLLTRAAQPLPEDTSLVLGQISLTTATRHSDPCAVWPAQGGLFDHRPFRPHSTFTVISPKKPALKLELDTPMPVEPLQSNDTFHVFMVGPDWPATAQLFVDSTLCSHLAFDIPPRAFTIPNIPQPLEANFNHEIQLLGYDLPTCRIQPGGRLPLTLYWRTLAYMGEDYHLFANPLDSEQRRWGGYDRRPRDGYSTLRWVPGEIITDPFGIPIDPDAPNGIYTLDFGFYRQTETGAESLSLVQDGQLTGQHSIRLGPIKVGGPPPDVTITNPTPQTLLNQSFSDQITLLGYDMIESIQNPKSKTCTECNRSIQNLKLTLYWQANTNIYTDYTTFLHLRDASNQNVAQKDSPPAAGRYPTGLWDPGEIIIDEILLPLADVSPGRYTPVVGLYNFATGERLLTPGNPANEIALEPINIP